MTDNLRWMDNAACISLTEYFYPNYDGEYIDLEYTREICGQCSVKDKCLEYALEIKDEEGVWAGYTAEERVEKFGNEAEVQQLQEVR